MKNPNWYYGTMKPPEGHVITSIQAPIRHFVEYAKWLFETIDLDNGVFKVKRRMTLKALHFGFVGEIALIREKQDAGHKDYNPWDAGATIHDLREQNIKYLKMIMKEFRRQRRALLGLLPKEK